MGGGGSTFGEASLEALYQGSLLAHSRTHILHVLCITAAALLLLALIHLPHPDVVLLLSALLASISLLLQALLLARPVHIKFVLYGTVQLLVLSAVCFYPAAHAALLPTSIAVFAVYSLLPLPLYRTLAICIFLSLAQIVAFAFFATPFAINHLLAAGLFHLWTHFVGFYSFTARERISRAAFLRARNAFAAEERAIHENAKLRELLQGAVPTHLIQSIRQQIAKSPPSLYPESYGHATVVYGRLVGLEEIVAQCSAQDSARLINEFNARIDHIARKCGCVRLQSDGIFAVCGVPAIRDDHARAAITFAADVDSLVRSFCDATTAELGFRCAVESGSVVGDVVGLSKWHFDVLGPPVDEVFRIESTVQKCGVFLGENTKREVECELGVERCGEGVWRLLPQRATSTIPTNVLFPNLRRFSLVTVPQAVNRLLQTITSANGSDSLMKTNALPGRRKKKSAKIGVNNEKVEDQRSEEKSLMRKCTLRFRSDEMENAFHMQLDQWFIPALAICIFFLVVYGVYHVLVLPRQIATLALIVVALAAMFVVLLMLYINFFQNFCQFITRTSVGHSIAILLILVLLFICGLVNTFSCPQSGDGDDLSECYVVHFSLLSCAFWMLTAAVFVRFPSLALLASLLTAVFLYSIHVFITHPLLYRNYARLTDSPGVEWELLLGLLTLASILFLQARRNERVLRLDFMSKLKEMEEKGEAEHVELANQKMLLNALPAHVAQNFFTKSELHHHLCHSVGIAYITMLIDDEENESAINNVKNMVSVFDQILMQHRGIEKIKQFNKTYVVAVGVIPEMSKNVHDTPSTIGDLLAELTQFALNVTAFAGDHGISLNIGIDCGSVLSAVVGSERPTYEICGGACARARTLMQHAFCYGVIVSEEIYLALRPRNFNFDPRPIKVTPEITAYVFDDCYPSDEEDEMAHSPTAPPETSTSQNPLEMFASMNSSFSSEVYSIDVGVETDSEMEWITPEMLLYERRALPSTSAAYLYDSQLSHPTQTDNSEYEELVSRERPVRRRRLRGRAALGCLSRSLTSEGRPERVPEGIDRLAAAASRVDRMLEELNAVAELDAKLDCRPFPTAALSTSSRSLRRELSSACHTEYDNAESEAVCSDSEMLGGRLEQLKHALKAGEGRRKRRRFWKYVENGNDADIDSICSSLNASSIFANLRWNSVHSIGYDNEYEIASREDLRELARGQMEALSRDIRNNFGDYQLATFSDIDA